MNDDEIKQQELEEEELRHSIGHLKEAQQKLGELAKAAKERREMMKKSATDAAQVMPSSTLNLAIVPNPGSPQEISTPELAIASDKEPQAQPPSLPGQKSHPSKQSEVAQVHTGEAVLKENFQSLHSK
jgi:hypothetical protein